ncbi:MAG: site-specific integrase [Phycisphaerales bacterium]|nr:site-specific integrase [Phycisphaerales bacterium]
MAGIKTSRDSYRTFSVNVYGQRHYIGGGSMGDDASKIFAGNLDELVSAKHRGARIDSDLHRWVGKLAHPIQDRLAEIGLVEPGKDAPTVDACPDADWRCIIALARWGGLRCPSEVLGVRWGDIDWGDDERSGRLLVRSPKTEHHAGKGERWVPLFPELREVLLAAFAQAEEGAEFVVARYRDRGVNLRTQLERIIARAGLTPWPRLFNAMRASRVTEIRAQFSGAVCSAWLGHSQGVSEAHYQMVRESDFERAAAWSGRAPSAPCAAPRLAPTGPDRSRHRRQKSRFGGSGQEVAVGVGGDQWAQQDSNL